MDYVARHYFPLKRGMATPGEILSDLPEEIIPRLLEKGAIEEVQGAFRSPPGTPSGFSAEEGRADRKPAKTVKANTESVPETAEVEAEADTEEAEVEIDALDGVVTAPKEEKPRTRKASTKAKGGKA